MTRLFDEATTDLCDLADIRALNAAIWRHRNSQPGYRTAAYRRLQREVLRQLQRNMEEKCVSSSH